MAEMIWSGAVVVYNFIMDNIVIINILFALVIVFFQRRSPQTVWTWLLLLYFIPILGFILYLIIGQDFHKSRMFKAKEIEGELKYAVRRQEETIYHKRLRLANPEMARFKDLILYNLEAGEAVLTDNNDIRIYTDGKAKFRALMEEMREAKRYIQTHYQNPDLSVDMICREFHMSPAYFSTMFKKETGQTYVAYLTEVRLTKAVELLNETDDKTYIIAQKVGYQEQNYFSYVFKKRFGVSPTRYRSVH